jgi:xylan 1,4-beta-xylosidase
LGYFDPAENQPWRQLQWSDVNTKSAKILARRAATEGIVLLKNNGVLPLSPEIKKIAVIGPYSNATTQLQGNYYGVAPYLITLAQGGKNAGLEITFTNGTGISSTSTAGFAEAVQIAKAADAIVFAGGIDQSIEREAHDRSTIEWPGNQLALIGALETLHKPLIVVQFGGGQVDDTKLEANKTVSVPYIYSIHMLTGQT